MEYNIVDTHIHVWDFSKAKYSWLEGDTTILNRTYRLDELAEERLESGVAQGVLVQAANNAEDTEWMLQVASNTDWIKGVVCWLPLADPTLCEKLLNETYLHNNYFKGVRHLIHNEPDDQWLLQENVLESLKLLAANNVPYDIVGVKAAHITTALKVAEKVPGLRMVFDHLNQPPQVNNENFKAWADLMVEAAKQPNFYAKISGLGTALGRPGGWTAEDIMYQVEFVLDTFGSDRCFCGGDWPVSLLAGSYSKTWKTYQQVLSEVLNEEDLKKVSSSNAVQFYNL